MAVIDRVMQSNESFVISQGSGCKIHLSDEDGHKKSIWCINSTDNLCFPGSVVTGPAYAARNHARSGESHVFWEKNSKDSIVQTDQARILISQPGMTTGQPA